MRLNDEELELVSIARGQSIDEMVAVVEHIVAARVAEALAPERRYHEVVEAWLWRWQCPPEALADLRAALATPEPTP